MRRTRLTVAIALLGGAIAFASNAAAHPIGRSAVRQQATTTAPASLLRQPEAHWVRVPHSSRRVLIAPLMLTVGEHNRIEAGSASVKWACQSIFGDGGPRGGNGCVSPISNATNDYCLSSYGQRTGSPVREYRCNPQSPNQIWWVTASGVYGETYEIWNVGSSCPPNLAWDSCGEPYGKGHGSAYDNYGFCIAVQGGQASQNAPLVMNGCKNGDLRAMSWAGGARHKSVWVMFDGQPTNGRYCMSSRGQARDGAAYVVAHCTLQTSQQFKAGTFGINTYTGGPPTGGGPP